VQKKGIAMLKIVFFISVVLTVFLTVAAAQPRVPIGDIPQDLEGDLKAEIRNLYSTETLERAQAAWRLGRGVALTKSDRILQESPLHQLAYPAIPFLVSMLNDSAQLEWRKTDGSSSSPTSPGAEAATALAKLGLASVPSLLNQLGNSSRPVETHARENSLRALRQVSGKDFRDDLTAWTAWWQEIRRSVEERLKKLSPEERKVLRVFLASDKNVAYYEQEGPVVKALVQTNILYISSGVSSPEWKFPFRIHDWARDYLQKNPNLLVGK
jgi:hypothetical protein